LDFDLVSVAFDFFDEVDSAMAGSLPLAACLFLLTMVNACD
jgi:hypothetical protein